MANWKKIYEKTIKNICEADSNEFGTIVEIEKPEFSADLIFNESADANALFRYKLDDNATKEDYKKFAEYIYNYIGEDINDYLPTEKENTMTEHGKIKKLLKTYGAKDEEIKNFIEDLENYKEDIEELDKAKDDEIEGTKKYRELAEKQNDNNLNEIADNEEEHNDYLFSAKNLKILKATKEGRDLILNAPRMAKEQLQEEIKKVLNK